MCKVISISNQKGGVAKTTTAVNLGIGLAKKGKKVLLIDADSQGSLTLSLGYSEPDEMKTTLATIMMNIVNGESVSPECGILHHEENIDLLPGNIALSSLEMSLGNEIGRDMLRREQISTTRNTISTKDHFFDTLLKEYIDMMRNYYDYILIDCMPSLGILTINSLVAADSVLIPMQAAYLSVTALQYLIKTISIVKKQLNRKLVIEGIVLTMVDFRTNYAKDIIAKVHNAYGSAIKVFESAIPISVKAAEASAEGVSIYRHCSNGKVSKAYKALTEEVLENEE